MIKEVFVNNYKCEKCNKAVDEGDTYCYFCGNKLDETIEYKELTPKQTRASASWENLG